MSKRAIKVSYSFLNPNTPQVFRQQLQKILVHKLLTQHTQSNPFQKRRNSK